MYLTSAIASQSFEFDHCFAKTLFRSSLCSQFISVIASYVISVVALQLFYLSLCFAVSLTSVIASQSLKLCRLLFRVLYLRPSFRSHLRSIIASQKHYFGHRFAVSSFQSLLHNQLCAFDHIHMYFAQYKC